MSRGRKRAPSPAKPPKRKIPGWAWLVLVVAAIAIVHVTFTTLESRRRDRLVGAIPRPDLTAAERRVATAIDRARASVEADPLSSDAWGALGATYDVHGMFDAAERCYREAHELDPAAFRWPYLLAIVRDVNGADAAEIAARFEVATDRRDDYAPAWFRLGHALALRGVTAQARVAYERAVALDPQLAPAHRELGQLLLTLDQHEGAIAALRRAAELAPDDGAIWSALAQAFTRAGRPDDARAAVDRARSLEPSTALSDPVHAREVTARGVSSIQLFERAAHQLERNDFAGTLRSVSQLLADDPSNAQAHYLAGTAYARGGNVERARAEFDLALETDPRHVGALLESGALLEQESRSPEAREVYLQAYEAEPNDPQVLASLARSQAQSGDDWGAARTFERLAAVTRLDARTLMNWGNALNRLERTDDAIARYRAALQMEPANAHVHFNLALALEDSGRRDEAITHYREALRLDPTLPSAAALTRLRAR